MGSLIALLRKDFLVEFRTKETLVVILSLSILLSVIASFGVSSAYLSANTTLKIFPMLLWMVFTINAAVSIGRGHDFELNERAIEGVILTGAPLYMFYISKVVSTSVFTLIGHLLSTILLAVLLNVSILDYSLGFAVISLLVVPCYCSLSVLLLGISSASRLKGMLLPVLLLPLLFPVFFCAVELTSTLISDSKLDYDSQWFSLLVFLDLIYLLLGVSLYEYVVRE